MKSPNSAVIVKLVAINKPSGHSDFKRWKAAIPNFAGRAFGQVMESFDKPYLVDESSDMVGLDEGITANFLNGLEARGFTDIRFVG